jgi:hypothetical protein
VVDVHATVESALAAFAAPARAETAPSPAPRAATGVTA